MPERCTEQQASKQAMKTVEADRQNNGSLSNDSAKKSCRSVWLSTATRGQYACLRLDATRSDWSKERVKGKALQMNDPEEHNWWQAHELCLRKERAQCGDKTLIAASYRQIESYWTLPPPPLRHARGENQSPKWMPSHRILPFHRFANIFVSVSLIQLMITLSDDDTNASKKLSIFSFEWTVGRVKLKKD